MTDDPALAAAIRASLLTRRASRSEIESWLDGLEEAGHFTVVEQALDSLRGWRIDPATGDLRHETGRFFTVQGVAAAVTAGGATTRWQQPVIVQTDIGVLGLVATIHDGVLEFLVQAKMEPGNARLVQVSPTVQATASNFERVHEGSPTPYLELFGPPDSPPAGALFLVRSLQSEQGSRYLGKRNLNAIVLVDAGHVPITDDRFRWLTLADLLDLADGRDLLHMDTRSILGSLPLDDTTDAPSDIAATIAWLDGQRSRLDVEARPIPVRSLPDWSMVDGRLVGAEPAPFSVVGVRVSASSREVASWDQPLIRNTDGAEGTLIVRRGPAGHEVLLSVMTGVGVQGGVELGPSTVRWAAGEPDVPLSDRTGTEALAATGTVLFDNVLPEEGGRFLHSSVRHRIIEVDVAVTPEGTRWLRLADVRALGRDTSLLNMELRSLLACLPAHLRLTR